MADELHEAAYVAEVPKADVSSCVENIRVSAKDGYGRTVKTGYETQA
jgi:hypothetical protein